MNDTEIENEIQAKGLDAPRITPEHIESTIVSEKYHRFANTTVTVCLLILKNGYTTVGHSACVSMDNFDEELGKKIARENAKSEIWPLEAYLLKNNITRPLGDPTVGQTDSSIEQIRPTTFVDRVFIERDELKIKHAALQQFFQTDTFEGLGDGSKNLMREQSNIMLAYISVLDDRLQAMPPSDLPLASDGVL